MRENNELIAEFLKLDRHPNNQRAYWIEDQSCYLTFDNLQFHRSWNQLMPVVEKIENDLLGQVEIHTAYTNINGEFNDLKYNQDTCFESQDDNKLTVTYRAIVRFLDWYNTTQQQPKPDLGYPAANPTGHFL